MSGKDNDKDASKRRRKHNFIKAYSSEFVREIGVTREEVVENEIEFLASPSYCANERPEVIQESMPTHRVPENTITIEKDKEGNVHFKRVIHPYYLNKMRREARRKISKIVSELNFLSLDERALNYHIFTVGRLKAEFDFKQQNRKFMAVKKKIMEERRIIVSAAISPVLLTLPRELAAEELERQIKLLEKKHG